MAKPKGKFTGAIAAKEPPSGKIRRSQLVSTYGPGAMLDLVDDAVLVGGLDFWRFQAGQFDSIPEPRLRDRLAEKFKAEKKELSKEHAFRLPPAGEDNDPTRYHGIQALEFPHWFVCQNQDCRALVRALDGLERKGDRYIHSCDGKSSQAVPVRFVAACRNGHLDDFPWIFFVHHDRPKCASPRLKLDEGATGDFSEVIVRCACGARRALIEAMQLDSNPQCRGRRPWLGQEGDEKCQEKTRLLVRTASNAYFPQSVSALSIPENQLEVRNAVESQWAILQAATPETLPAFKTVPAVKAAIAHFSDDDVLAAVKALKNNTNVFRDPLRTAEFKQFLAAKDDAPGEIPDADELFFARRAVIAPAELVPGIERVVLVHKLREVRVQIGFTRLAAATPDLQGEFQVASAPLGLLSDWLPAAEIRGEGIFIQLDEKAVRAWEDRPAVQARAKELMAGYDQWRAGASQDPGFPGVRFYLLHSLSHLLITAVSLECGYSASAIRERIYCAPRTDAVPMAGILLSTGSPGTEGTLGGLVEQGRHIRRHVKAALELGTLCSNDPVCASHSPREDLSERNLEGAACHGCLFIAECSCERFNSYLDRALVVPAIGHPGELAFLGGVVK